MSRESIMKIRETEEKADRIVAEAKQRAQQMTEQARLDGKALCETTERETADSLKAMLSDIRTRTESMSERFDAESGEAVDALNRSVSLRRKIAEKIIIRGFEKKCR